MAQAKGEFTYRDAGVDIDAKMTALDRIKRHVASTATKGSLGAIGGFGGLFELDLAGLRSPVLVSSTDSVGSKVEIAFLTGRHDTVGQDIVNHGVNDVLVTGARPLFVLDYVGAGRVDPDVIEQIVAGVAVACRENGCALVGGETAELPDLYAAGTYDLVATVVGVVEKDAILDGSRVAAGDALIGLASNGLHTNGFTLVRKVLLGKLGLDLAAEIPELGRTLGDELLRVHRSYVRPVAALRARVEVRALAHLTGGGFLDNVPRVLPVGVGARVDVGSWDVPPIFRMVEEASGIDATEAHRVFNRGIGMVAIVPAEQAADAITALAEAGCDAWRIGETTAGDRRVTLSSGA